MTRFFVKPEQIVGEFVYLDGDDAHHLRVVLHAQPGTKIAVLDGSGQEWPAALTELGKTKASAQLREPFEPKTESNVQVTVAQALPKVGDKMEQVLQRGTEIGAAGFWVYSSERSLTHLTGERQEKRQVRWSAIVKTAAEQAHRAILPTLNISGEVRDVFSTASEYDCALIAYEGETETTLKQVLSAQTTEPKRVLVIIGPEGGFSDTEIKAARKAGVQTVSLGPRILRTETAALVMVAQILFASE
jgi:16S rRNA (uracil1498-N3)-methyltransferase